MWSSCLLARCNRCRRLIRFRRRPRHLLQPAGTTRRYPLTRPIRISWPRVQYSDAHNDDYYDNFDSLSECWIAINNWMFWLVDCYRHSSSSSSSSRHRHRHRIIGGSRSAIFSWASIWVFPGSTYLRSPVCCLSWLAGLYLSFINRVWPGNLVSITAHVDCFNIDSTRPSTHPFLIDCLDVNCDCFRSLSVELILFNDRESIENRFMEVTSIWVSKTNVVKKYCIHYLFPDYFPNLLFENW